MHSAFLFPGKNPGKCIDSGIFVYIVEYKQFYLLPNISAK